MPFSRLRTAWQRLTVSFWLVPSTMAVLAIVFAFALLGLDRAGTTRGLEELGPPFSIGVDGARSLLSTITGSVITVASLVFSLILIALTLAAGSIGARLLQRYMRKRTIQLTLGVFVATFVYSLLVQSALGGAEYGVPRLSVFVALLLAIASLFWLIFAFHDLARTIQVDNAVASLSNDLVAALTRQAEAASGCSESALPQKEMALPVRFDLPCETDGYVRSIDHEALVTLAAAADAVVRVRCGPGDFLLREQTLAEVRAAADSEATERLRQEVPRVIVLGPSRSELGDPTFRIHLLVEIATRALSPGVNDLYSALICIDHLGRALATALRLGLHSGEYCDNSGTLRVVGHALSFETLVDAALNPIRQAAAGLPPVQQRLLGIIAQLASLTSDDKQKVALKGQADCVLADAQEKVRNDVDREAIREAHRAALIALERR